MEVFNDQPTVVYPSQNAAMHIVDVLARTQDGWSYEVQAVTDGFVIHVFNEMGVSLGYF